MPLAHSRDADWRRDTAPHDELGTPASALAACDCGLVFRRGGAHRCGVVGGWVSWEGHRLREAFGA